MKSKDIALIAVIILFSATISTLISKALFNSSKQKSLTVEVVEPINPEFKKPDPDFFNDQSINPTKLIQIGNNNNTRPF